jgi:hypothetical protein
MILVPERTTCTKNIVMCPVLWLFSHCIRIWLLDTGLASVQFMYFPLHPLSVKDVLISGHPRGGNSQNRGCQASVYSTIAHQKPQISAPASCSQGRWKEGFLGSKAQYLVDWSMELNPWAGDDMACLSCRSIIPASSRSEYAMTDMVYISRRTEE